MELKLQTGNGELLNELLNNWLKNSVEIATDRVKRVLIMFSGRVKNEDEFIAALYGHIGAISRGDTGDMSPAAETLQGTTNVFVPCMNLRITSQICYELAILPPKRTQNTTKGAKFCAFGALQLLSAEYIFAAALISATNTKIAYNFTPTLDFVPCTITAGIAPMYGQNVGDKTPLELRENLRTAVLRVQHVIELACQKRKLKELVAALEWSGNEAVLAEILKWAEEASTEVNSEEQSTSEELSLKKLSLSSGEVEDEQNKTANSKVQAAGDSGNKSGLSGADSSAASKHPVVPQGEEQKHSGSATASLAKLPISTASAVMNGSSVALAANVHVDFSGNRDYDHYYDELEYCGNDQDSFDIEQENYDDGYDPSDDAYGSIHDVCEYDSDTDQISY